MKNKKIIYLIILISFFIVVLVYSRFIGTSSLFINEIPVKGLTSSNFHGIKVVHLSDIHFGRVINSEKRLNEIKNKINLVKPDIVVLTGDLIDRDTVMNEEVEKMLIDFLKGINADLGKYAILGNHDVNFDNWNKIISSFF